MTTTKLKEVLSYCSETGEFRWLINKSSRAQKGALAGTFTSYGYRQIRINGRSYRAARLAWLYVYGEWPDGQIDHINRNRNDDRIDNLRVVTVSENNKNRGRGWSFSNNLARVGFTDTNGNKIVKSYSCSKYGWLTAGKLAAKFVLENRPKDYRGAE